MGLEEFENYTPVRQKDIVQQKGYRFQYKTKRWQVKQALKMINPSESEMLYVGGGAGMAHDKELLELVDLFQIPITSTLMGKGSISNSHKLALGMLGMHGTAYANFSVSECDLLIAVGARFDDRVTGKLDDFACHAQVIHIDIDPAEISKNRIPQLALVGDVKKILQEILKEQVYDSSIDLEQTKPWRKRITRWKQTYPLIVPSSNTTLSPQEVITTVNNIAKNAFFTTDVGQHQMWAAQYLGVMLVNGLLVLV